MLLARRPVRRLVTRIVRSALERRIRRMPVSNLEIWLLAFPTPGRVSAIAQMAESVGWDGLLLADSQNLSGDPYSALCLAAEVTKRLRLGTGVTNPVTRHPAVTASAICTVHVESGGRAVLGIGRGDSSLAYLGQEPAPLRQFEQYIKGLQGYLLGKVVDLDGYPSRNEWIASTGLPKVPVDVAATGPRTIALGARLAERVTFAVGADPERLRWAIDIARQARVDAGLDPNDLSLGAYINAVVHPDIRAARDLARGGLASFAHFSGMRGHPLDQVRSEDRTIFEQLGQSYDMANHGKRSAKHTQVLDDAFVDRFGIVGPSQGCIKRLTELLELGLDRLVIICGSRDASMFELAGAYRRFASEVIPALKAWRARHHPEPNSLKGDR